MIGVVLASVGALLLVFADALKKQLGNHLSYKLVIWNTVFAGIVTGSIASYATGASIADPKYLLWLPVATALLILGEITFIKSIVSADFSEVAPIRAVAPVYSVCLGILFLGEYPTLIALVGVFLVVAGVWMISPKPVDRAIPRFSAGVKYMLASQLFTVLMAITIKTASAGVSPLIFFTFMMVGEWVYFSFAIMHGRIHPLGLIRFDPFRAVLMSLLWAVGILAISIAPSYTLVAYAYASGQLYLPMSLVVGAYMLKEHEVLRRVKPAAIILIGVILIIFEAS